MRKRSSAPTRAIAAIALIGGFLLVAVVVATSLGGGSSGGHSDGGGGQSHRQSAAQRHVPKSYVVQSGDTLTSISHRTGVPGARIRALNPGLDPQILIAGEKLKLR
jgi:LysM repeat protein